MKHRYPHSIDPRAYQLDSTKRTWTAAKHRKRRLKQLGYRVKIRKDINGQFAIWKKDVQLIAAQRDQGNGRVHA
jgi:hypothetical protein